MCPLTFVGGHQPDDFCRVIEDCVAGSSEHAHEYALSAMPYLQAGARRSLVEVLEAMDNYQTRISAAEPAATAPNDRSEPSPPTTRG